MSTQTKLAAAARTARDEPPAVAIPKTAQPRGAPLVGIDSEVLMEVPVSLDTCLGATELSLQELLALKSGSIVKLDYRLNELVELRLNGAVVARGEIVAVGDNFGVRIVEIGKVE